MNEAYNIDCMEFMRRVPSKYFDLAVVDPPYGIEKGFKETSRVRRYGQTKTANDDKPTAEYFTELFRVSKNQIIWATIICRICCRRRRNSFSGTSVSPWTAIPTAN